VAEIVDSGPGIPAEMREQLFNPFFSTRHGGTGLGLPISQRIVEEHGGAIEVQSQPGTGTTFRVLLPIVSDEQGTRG
jgi:signal transduction histidine kinase